MMGSTCSYEINIITKLFKGLETNCINSEMN